jgi:parallel beta-helix repeat protein
MPARTILGTVLAAGLLLAPAAHAVDPGSQLIGCALADTPLTISVSSHLDPSCTWTRGIDIVASDVVFDCQGAHIATTDRRYGVLITAPTTAALSNITVRNCHVEGFLNNFHVEREGFRDLAEGVEYENAFSDIVIEDSTSLNSRGVGIFVNGYVTDVTLRNLHVEGAGSAGIYLETGSKDNVVENNQIVNNGYGENGPQWQYFEPLGVWFWGVGREGIAIDGSRNNLVTGNHFSGNSAGSIFLYKNCGEFWISRPNRWFDRRYGANGNVIEHNTFAGDDIGVWVGSRMGENTLPMECSDPAYYEDALTRVVHDVAKDNVVRDNVFQNVPYGIRVEDDGTVVEGNEFTSADAGHQAVIVGTRFRTPLLGLPVANTAISGNRATIAGNGNPYRWIHGHTGTTFTGNEAFGRVVGFCEGVQPPTTPFIFVLAFAAGGPDDPPTDPGPVVPPPDPLPPCPLACASGGAAEKPFLAIRRLDTPPGDDTLTFRGRTTLPHPFDPALDPVAVGAAILVTDAAQNRVLDLTVPGGAFDPATKVGWKASPSRGTWKYVNRSDAPPAGVIGVTVKDLSKKAPGLVKWSVKGRRGAYPVDMGALPLAGVMILDPPTAETGQCGVATFPGPMPICTGDVRSVRCR